MSALPARSSVHEQCPRARGRYAPGGWSRRDGDDAHAAPLAALLRLRGVRFDEAAVAAPVSHLTQAVSPRAAHARLSRTRGVARSAASCRRAAAAWGEWASGAGRPEGGCAGGSEEPAQTAPAGAGGSSSRVQLACRAARPRQPTVRSSA